MLTRAGKKHQTSLARRAAKEAGDSTAYQTQALAQQALLEAAVPQKQFVKIGSPGYSVSKVKDLDHNQLGLLFRIHYPQIKDGVRPIYRFMSAFEQRIEAPDRNFQYLLVAAEPYATIGFRIPAREIEGNGEGSFEHYDVDTKQYTCVQRRVATLTPAAFSSCSGGDRASSSQCTLCIIVPPPPSQPRRPASRPRPQPLQRRRRRIRPIELGLPSPVLRQPEHRRPLARLAPELGRDHVRVALWLRLGDAVAAEARLALLPVRDRIRDRVMRVAISPTGQDPRAGGWRRSQGVEDEGQTLSCLRPSVRSGSDRRTRSVFAWNLSSPKASMRSRRRPMPIEKNESSPTLLTIVALTSVAVA